MTLPSNAISARDAAKIIGIEPITLRKIMREGKIKGVKIKKNWYVDLDSLKEYIGGNGSQRSKTVEINGERAVRVGDFAKKRGISSIQRVIKDNRLTVHKLNGAYFITESEVKRYDKRFSEFFGRKIIGIQTAASRLNITVEQLYERIERHEIDMITVENKPFVFKDELERLAERVCAGDDFLAIPENGRIRREIIPCDFSEEL